MSLGICGLKFWQRVWFKRSGVFGVEFNTASPSNIRTQVPQEGLQPHAEAAGIWPYHFHWEDAFVLGAEALDDTGLGSGV